MQEILFKPDQKALTLRGYQEEAINKIKQGIKEGHQRQVLMLATGGGKTLIASRIMQGVARKGNRACFIVDSVELIEQAYHRFDSDGLWVGVIQGDHHFTNWAAPIQVATIQSLRSRWNRIPDEMRFDLIVIDECHVLHNAHIKIMETCGCPVIGLSATPFRKKLGNYFSNLILGATTKYLTDNNYLVPADIYIGKTADMTKVKKKADGDWDGDSAGEAMSGKEIIGDIVSNWFRLGQNRKTMVFCCNVAHSKKVRDQFENAEVSCAHVDGYMPSHEREIIIEKFRRGKIKILCNCGVLTKGFDVPDVGCLVVARPTKSLMLHIQILGRGLRTHPGKTDCIILDHTKNCIDIGSPVDILPQVLHVDGKDNPDRKKRDKKEALEKPCPSCGFLKPAKVFKCPKCHFETQVQSTIGEVQGELVRMKDGKSMSKEQKQDVYAQLLQYSKDHGYNPGWAYHKCIAICGSAPRNTKQIDPKPISTEMRKTIRHLNIKYAKRKNKDGV